MESILRQASLLRIMTIPLEIDLAIPLHFPLNLHYAQVAVCQGLLKRASILSCASSSK